MTKPDSLVRRARALEDAVRKAAEGLTPGLKGEITNAHAEALRLSALRLVPRQWQWRIEPSFGGSAVFFITNYLGA